MKQEIKLQRIEALFRDIKGAMGRANHTYTSLAKALNERLAPGEPKISTQSLSQKIKRGLLPYIEVQEILDVLGYNVEVVERKTK